MNVNSNIMLELANQTRKLSNINQVFSDKVHTLVGQNALIQDGVMNSEVKGVLSSQELAQFLLLMV